MPIMNTVIAGGGTTPTGTITITSNGITDVTNYATADVQVPTTGPDAYIPLEINNGVLSRPTAASYTYKFPDAATEIARGTLLYAFGNTGGIGINQNFTAIDFNNVEIIRYAGAYRVCEGATNLTSVNMSKVKTLENNALYAAFKGTSIASISFPALETVDSASLGTGSTSYAFGNCTLLTEIHFPAAMQATVEAMTGYSAKWGATNATIYFDL